MPRCSKRKRLRILQLEPAVVGYIVPGHETIWLTSLHADFTKECQWAKCGRPGQLLFILWVGISGAFCHSSRKESCCNFGFVLTRFVCLAHSRSWHKIWWFLLFVHLHKWPVIWRFSQLFVSFLRFSCRTMLFFTAISWFPAISTPLKVQRSFLKGKSSRCNFWQLQLPQHSQIYSWTQSLLQ